MQAVSLRRCDKVAADQSAAKPAHSKELSQPKPEDYRPDGIRFADHISNGD